MKVENSRRTFLTSVAIGAGTAVATGAAMADEVKRPLTVGVMGLQRGLSLAHEFATKDNVQVKYVCDVDKSRVKSAIKGWIPNTQSDPIGTQRWTDLLEDPEVDILVCAAPNHWHAPATILACQAGKHVYVEKPCSHNPQEGTWMVQAAAKHARCVQVGTQRRSSSSTQEAIQKLHDGVIGRVYLARAYYNSARGPIPAAEPSDPPDALAYELWQGPAPRKPYRSNVVHYNWHWFWHWGGGELANNGVHTLDLCRWGLGVDVPIAVSASGGRYAFEDVQETPDTYAISWEFSSRQQITWHSLSCNRHGNKFVEFFGDNGALELDSDGGHRIYDARDELLEEVGGDGVGQAEHVANFLDCVRNEDSERLHCGIADANASTMLCHYGNIALRVGKRITVDESNGQIVGEESAQRLWQRDYSEGWLERLENAAQ